MFGRPTCWTPSPLISSGCPPAAVKSPPTRVAMADGAPARAREVLLVGSVGLRDNEEVFRTVGPLLGQRMARIPDGETGERTSWVTRLRRVIEDNPAFEDDPAEKSAGGRITH